MFGFSVNRSCVVTEHPYCSATTVSSETLFCHTSSRETLKLNWGIEVSCVSASIGSCFELPMHLFPLEGFLWVLIKHCLPNRRQQSLWKPQVAGFFVQESEHWHVWECFFLFLFGCFLSSTSALRFLDSVTSCNLKTPSSPNSTRPHLAANLNAKFWQQPCLQVPKPDKHPTQSCPSLELTLDRNEPILWPKSSLRWPSQEMVP